MSWADAGQAAAGGALLVLPIAATEQHGPHLPLSTDTDIAVALANALAADAGDVVVAPVLAYGSSGEHADFPGTISIGQAALELVLIELVRSVSVSFSRVLLVSTHGGNCATVRRAEKLLRSEAHNVRAFFARWPGDAHAGRVETSLMLAIDPHRVRVELAASGSTATLDQLMPGLVRDGVRKISANGVLGDPTGASADEGQELLDSAVRQMSALLKGWEEGS